MKRLDLGASKARDAPSDADELDRDRSKRESKEPTEVNPPSFYEDDLQRYLHKFKHAIKERTLLKSRLNRVAYFGD